MAHWCRSIITAAGPEPEVARFVDYIEQEDEDQEGTFKQIADCYLTERAPGRARYEVIAKYRPPLDHLAEVSRKFPTLTLQVDWEQPGDGMIGCAVIVAGNRNVLELDDLLEYARKKFRTVYQEQLQHDWGSDYDEADVALSWESLREASGRFFGGRQDMQEEADGLWAAAKAFARQVVQESDGLLPFTGKGVLTDNFGDWRDYSAAVPDDQDLEAANFGPPEAELEQLVRILIEMWPPSQVEWQREGF